MPIADVLRSAGASLVAILTLAFGGWLLSRVTGKVSVVDSLWPCFFLLAALVYALSSPGTPWTEPLVLVLVGTWALRLSTYLSWRNWGKPEDRRYAALQKRHQPGFAWKSLYLVFGFQAVLAWLVSLPILAACWAAPSFPTLVALGAGLAGFGVVFEAVADYQLARFRKTRSSSAQVLDRGLWSLSRHPNYFAEACLWWGIYLIATSAGGWWTIASPLLMTWLLTRFSGVPLLEADLKKRNPAYAQYCQRVPAFVPRIRWRGKAGIFPGAILLGFLLGIPCTATGASARTWEFQVALGEQPIGQHRFELQNHGDGSRTLISEAQFEVKFWIVPVYRYRHRAVERWQDGCLTSLESATVENGKETKVRVQRSGNRFLVEKDQNTKLSLEGCVWTFAYWNPEILQRGYLLNPQTAEWVPVRIEERGEEFVPLGAALVRAKRYSLLGPNFRIDLWYTPEGEWVRLESELEEGRRLVYTRAAPDSSANAETTRP